MVVGVLAAGMLVWLPDPYLNVAAASHQATRYHYIPSASTSECSSTVDVTCTPDACTSGYVAGVSLSQAKD